MDTRVQGSDASTYIDLGNQVKQLTLSATTPTYSMKAHDHIIHAISSQADAASIITLPSLAEAAGKFYFICATTGAAGGDISLYEKETGSELSTNGDMDADDDHLLLFSDGVKWRTILDGVA